MRDESTLIFTGDIGFDKYMDQKWEDPELLSAEVLDFVRSGDHLIINVEGPLYDAGAATGTVPTPADADAASGTVPTPTTCGATASGSTPAALPPSAAALLHSMNPAAADFFDKIGADVWNICNNHICDAGPDGIASTLKIAGKHGVQTLGAGLNLSQAAAPVYLDEAGGIGMIGVGYQRACRKAGEDTPGCFSWSDLDLIREQIAAIKQTCRWCIVVAHAGEEFTALPSPYTRKRYLDYLEMGADIVVAHHPHVPMNYETFPAADGSPCGKAIFYSLGNFIFDTDYQRSQFNTEFGILLSLQLKKDSFGFTPLGILIDRTCDHVVQFDLPAIFADVQEGEYVKLAPLAAQMFIANTKRQLLYMKPDQFRDATEEDWLANFYEPLRSGRVPGECLDMQIVYPLSLEAEKGAWRASTLEGVKEYMLAQL